MSATAVPEEFTARPDLASRLFGSGIVHTNDEFFAAADHLLQPAPPVFSPKTFGHKGQVYDGWESRRRRTPGHDFAVVRLGAPGVIHGVDIDTSFFTGNFPPQASVEATAVDGYPTAADLSGAAWETILPKSPLAGDSQNLFPVRSSRRWTHLRLNIHPDGGVARFRAYGEIVPDPRLLPEVFNVAAAQYGARVTACSNMFYGHPQHMLMPGLAATMGDGWETSRRRDEGNDWVVVQLAVPTVISHADLDTTHFKGNAPGRAALHGLDARTSSPDDPDAWFPLLPETPLSPDTPHRFPLGADTAATHVRMDIYPDGGMARLRLLGRPDTGGVATLRTRFTESTRPPDA